MNQVADADLASSRAGIYLGNNHNNSVVGNDINYCFYAIRGSSTDYNWVFGNHGIGNTNGLSALGGNSNITYGGWFI